MSFPSYPHAPCHHHIIPSFPSRAGLTDLRRGVGGATNVITRPCSTSAGGTRCDAGGRAVLGLGLICDKRDTHDVYYIITHPKAAII